VPTARELLEQADALMRRNRARADDDIPILTDAVPFAPEVTSRYAPPLRPAELPAPASDDGDDVPLLTDEVEEIEAAAIDAEVDEGEPSVWLDFQDAEPSVIGDAPDSIAIVPPVDLHRPPPAPAPEEFDEIDEELAAAIAAAPAESEEFDAIDEIDEIDEGLAAANAAAPPEEESLQPAALTQPVPDAWSAPPPHQPVRESTVIAGGAAALLHGDPASLATATAAATGTAIAPISIGAPAQPAPAMPTPPSAAPDAAHWEAMAEEIRMQVLQRIDLFTDTGLRTQLGARLQPIVDRASADLVATINQHVGELLREYVAEAIEREIDSWRRNH